MKIKSTDQALVMIEQLRDYTRSKYLSFGPRQRSHLTNARRQLELAKEAIILGVHE